NYGLLKAKTAGSCNIKASLEQTYQSLLFSIKDASLQSISISPDNILIVKGTQIQLTATGYYSDNTSSDISNQVHWKSSNTFTSVSNENEAKGLTSAIEVGSSTVTANYKDISGTATITVGAATLESITVSSISSDDFLKGTNKSFIAIGTYSDQSTQDISKQVLWSTSNKTIATASNAYATAGQLTGINAGSIILSATFDSISSNQLNITIIDDPAAAVSLSSDATPYIILNDGVDSAIITLSAKAADTTAIVSDGTEIQLEIVDGIGTISTASVTTINGEAAFNITSDTKNLIKIKASIVGTEIFSIAYVNVVDTFKEVITRYGSVTGSLNNDLVAVGSKMEFKIRNDSNRPFIIEGYRVLNNNAIVVQTSDPAILNNNTLSAEGNIVVVFTTTQELSNSYIGVYYLREPTTNMQFFVAASFTF
ncbi:MAG: Ig-like domain-containing protein, partial [Gammaproteobacteria bacterium]|nr:Ig-like domain-containing protein [Gammaproteobacteria bacterium]